MDSDQSEEGMIREEIARLAQQLAAITKRRVMDERREALRLEIETEAPERPKEPRIIDRVEYKYGSCPLKI